MILWLAVILGLTLVPLECLADETVQDALPGSVQLDVVVVHEWGFLFSRMSFATRGESSGALLAR